MPMFSPELWLRTFLEALPSPPLAWFSSELPLWRKITPGLLLIGLSLLTSACGRTPAEVDNCGDVTGRPGYKPVGEYFYAAWGPNDLLAVIYMPKDSSGNYLYEQGGIFIMHTDGSGLRQVLQVPYVLSAVLSLAWSPDGQWIAFDAGGQIYKISAGGDSPVQLTTDGRSKYAPTWSPDGQWLAYHVPYGERRYRGLWTVKADGSEQFQFRRPPEEEMCFGCPIAPPDGVYGPGPEWAVLDPTWSPNGHDIAYHAFDHNADADVLIVYDTTSTRAKIILHTGRPQGIYHPEFSPDGSRIVFATSNGDIWVVNQDGTGVRRITTEGENPGWSPDGKRVVFRRVTWDYCHYQDPGYGEIWIVNADGSGEHQVTYSYHSNQTNITARAVP